MCRLHDTYNIALKSTFYYYFENPWKPPSLVTDNKRRFRHEQKRMRYIYFF